MASARRREPNARDQPRSEGSRRADAWGASSIFRRLHAVPLHDVLADQESGCTWERVHAPRGGCRDDRYAGDWGACQSGGADDGNPPGILACVRFMRTLRADGFRTREVVRLASGQKKRLRRRAVLAEVGIHAPRLYMRRLQCSLRRSRRTASSQAHPSRTPAARTIVRRDMRASS